MKAEGIVLRRRVKARWLSCLCVSIVSMKVDAVSNLLTLTTPSAPEPAIFGQSLIRSRSRSIMSRLVHWQRMQFERPVAGFPRLRHSLRPA